jgi:hypothetical protein
LRATDPDAFQSDLVPFLQKAGIVLPRAFLAALTTIGFEAQSNAEEYGFRSYRYNEDAAFRIIAGIQHEVSKDVAPLAAEYFGEYFRAGHSPKTRWLELLVVDGGVGLAYPRYKKLAEESQWPEGDVYLTDYATERTMLNLVLNKGESTKGLWGRIINRHTVMGQGIKMIRFRLATARACALVRSGRAFASWYHPKQQLQSVDFANLPEYESSELEGELYYGTAWQVLLPLDPQLDLAV